MLTEKLRFLSFFKTDKGGGIWDIKTKDLFFPFLLRMRCLTGEFRRDIEESQMTIEAPEQGLPK